MNYLTNTSELTTVADAIREKGGTSAPLTYPFGFVSAIQDIQTGGDIDVLIGRTISDTYENNTAREIGVCAFQSCSALAEVKFGDCSNIASSAFYDCSSLTSADFPKCSAIGSRAFMNCGSLVNVSFPKCSTVDASAFNSCISLLSVEFPSCTYVDIAAFAGCTLLQSVSFPIAITIGTSAFMQCKSLTEVEFPECTKINPRAFLFCSSLATARFPKCTRIDSAAFSGCTHLTSLNLMGSSVAVLSNSNAFVSTPIGGYSTSAGQFGSIYVPASLLTSYQTATNWTFYSSRFVGV